MGMDKLLYSVSEATQMLSVGRSVVYELIADGKIHVVKIGRRTLIARDELERFVQSLT